MHCWVDKALRNSGKGSIKSIKLLILSKHKPDIHIYTRQKKNAQCSRLHLSGTTELTGSSKEGQPVKCGQNLKIGLLCAS